jgi:hypothetical protein
MVSQEFQGEFIRENVVEHLDTVFVKTKLFPAVLGLRKYCFMHEIVICVSRPRNHNVPREKLSPRSLAAESGQSRVY